MKKSCENTPILVANTEWPLPDTLIQDVKQERMTNALLSMACPDMDYKDLVGYAEVVAYIMPHTSRMPLHREEAEIYLYCVRQLMKKRGIEFAEGLDKLDESQTHKLNKLKKWIFDNRGGKESNPVIDALQEVFKTY